MSAHLNVRQLAAALRTAADWATWERDSLEDFHAYAHRFGCAAGINVYQFVLEDALRHRGLTLDQLRLDAEAVAPTGGDDL